MSALAKTRYFLRSAAGGLRHAPFVHFIAVLTIAIALFSAGLAHAVAERVQGLLASLGGEVQLTVYLDPALPPDAALSRLRKELGDLGDTLAQLEQNPLPPSLELQVPAQARTPGALRALATELRALPGVSGVDYGEEAVERLSAIARALSYGGWVAFAIIGLATVIIVAATLQLAIYARRSEIEIQKLVGATDRFVKAPFLLEGLLQGVLGALLALGALALIAHLVAPVLGEIFAFQHGAKAAAPGLDLRLSLGLLGAGCALGLGGSFIAVGRFLRV